MTELILEKKCKLDLKKKPPNMYDKLSEDYTIRLKSLIQKHHLFVDEVIIPQIKLFNSIGFYAKGFDLEYIMSSIEGFDFDIFSDYLEKLGLICTLKDTYSIFRPYVYIDWRAFIFNANNKFIKDSQTSLTCYLANHHSDFNNPIYDKCEDFLHKYVFQKMLENNLGDRTFTLELPKDYSNVFYTITLIEILKRNNIYSKPNCLDFSSLELNWSSSYDVLVKNHSFDVFCTKFFIDCFEGNIKKSSMSYIPFSTIQFEKSIGNFSFYLHMLDGVVVPVEKKKEVKIKSKLSLEYTKSVCETKSNNFSIDSSSNTKDVIDPPESEESIQYNELSDIKRSINFELVTLTFMIFGMIILYFFANFLVSTLIKL